MIDLATAKAHLNVTTDIDDALITRLIAAAQDWMEAQLGYKVAEKYQDSVPPALDQGILLMVAHWYANRESTIVGVNAQTLPLGVSDIVNDFRNWSWGEPADE